MTRALLFTLCLALFPASSLAELEIPPKLKSLLEPRVVELPAQQVLVVEAKGDPNAVGPGAFGLLFQLYYQIPDTPKGPAQPAPRARWPVSVETPRDEWIGYYALPVPDSVKKLPPHQAPANLSAALALWDYGQTAEILHVGPYNQEEPTIQRLREYASAQGYELAGEHEEEYVRGPTLSGPGNPDEYLTILRYRAIPSEDSAGP